MDEFNFKLGMYNHLSYKYPLLDGFAFAELSGDNIFIRDISNDTTACVPSRNESNLRNKYHQFSIS